jgi:hypothetical protein
MPDIVDPAHQPEADERKRCQFCAYRGTLTNEHIWPRRFRRNFPEFVSALHERGTTGAGQEDVRVTWEAPAFSTKRKITCDPCNHVRLEKIEREAVSYVVSMARGTMQGDLPLTAQRKLAAFALRMVAVGQYLHPQERPVPRSHRAHLALNLSPPQRTEVWAFCCADGDLHRAIRLQAGSQRLAAPGERMPVWANSYRGILRIGHLVLELAARMDGRSFPVLPPDSRAFVRLWPIEFNRVGIWPPDRLLTEVEFERRVASFDEPATYWPRPV